MKRAAYLLITGMIGILLLSGCGGKNSASSHEHGLDSEKYETTSSITVMPKFLSVYTDNTQASYASVGEIEDILKDLKCYCGCMDNGKLHDSLHRCFIAEKNDDGVKWTDHGAQCGTCLSELQDAKRMNDEGKSMDEIRDFIDNKYKGTTPQV
ncbi:PCYCGC motif-containing (lipo)protein [Paenibacillus dakarensis]|uniref:PCYCGC motif-containing (lipo)protein n=1 Tax=Paenibacillus dakarensis TaxID=1527293 RepID=UPI0006D53F7E|nr:PCYCGC motif-containing (lipo)protein [Paenibacillus dakarensis]